MEKDVAEVDGIQHLTPETVEEYFRSGAPAAFPLSKRVDAELQIHPVSQELRLICPAIGSEPDVATYERITVERVIQPGQNGEWYQLTVDATGMHYEAYMLIESVVDELNNGATFRQAVSDSLTGLKDLLSGRRRMMEEVESGLIGELLVLGHAIARIGEDAAVDAWLGPQGEEHDFGFETYDAEIKTTRSEGRTHRIGSETQLQPEPGRPLYLVSVQLTKAGVAAEAFSLPHLIARTRVCLDRGRQLFDRHLESLGWHDADADLYQTRFQLRALARAYLVDEDFPAITSVRLDSVIPQRMLVSGVSYRVDVTHLEFARVPEPLDDYCEEPL